MACQAYATQRSLQSTIRAWAQFCHPDRYSTAIDATPIADLLPGFEHYLAHVLQQASSGIIKAPTGVTYVRALQMFLQDQQQLINSSGVASYQKLQDQAAATLAALHSLSQTSNL